MEATSNEFLFGGVGGMDNPFSEPVSINSNTEDLKSKEIEIDPLDILREIRASKIAEATATVVSNAAAFIAEGIKYFFDQVFVIIKQAIKMALFKFALETCAMGIKSLIETMTSMSLTPPNIDTKGVYYNFTGSTQTTTGINPATATPSQPRYDNPFGNPFGPSW